MTQEEKQLLLKDLCARLPYGLKGIRTYKDYETVEVYDIIPKCKMNPNVGDGIFTEISFTNMDCCTIEEFKPYLRPMSSMPEEEKKTYKSFFSIGEYACGGTLYGKEYEYINSDSEDISESISLLDWLNAHCFDYRGLIEKGLALEAPDGMYKTE